MKQFLNMFLEYAILIIIIFSIIIIFNNILCHIYSFFNP